MGAAARSPADYVLARGMGNDESEAVIAIKGRGSLDTDLTACIVQGIRSGELGFSDTEAFSTKSISLCPCVRVCVCVSVPLRQRHEIKSTWF